MRKQVRRLFQPAILELENAEFDFWKPDKTRTKAQAMKIRASAKTLQKECAKARREIGEIESFANRVAYETHHHKTRFMKDK